MTGPIEKKGKKSLYIFGGKIGGLKKKTAVGNRS